MKSDFLFLKFHKNMNLGAQMGDFFDQLDILMKNDKDIADTIQSILSGTDSSVVMENILNKYGVKPEDIETDKTLDDFNSQCKISATLSDVISIYEKEIASMTSADQNSTESSVKELIEDICSSEPVVKELSEDDSSPENESSVCSE